jgi:acetyltransferase-like isoleucine patch superfamily enzyme
MVRVRQLVALIAGLCPIQPLKRLIYRVLLGYQIDRGAWIGFAFIDVRHLSIGPGARISHMNRIQGPFTLTLASEAQIKRGNSIVLSRHYTTNSEMRIGSRSIITRYHFFDLGGNIVIGEDTVLGGIGSQFWTHSFSTSRELLLNDIEIGSNCFIGSAVRFSPGSVIGDHCIVGIGSVVTRRFNDTHVLIAGVPAQVVRSIPTQVIG